MVFERKMYPNDLGYTIHGFAKWYLNVLYIFRNLSRQKKTIPVSSFGINCPDFNPSMGLIMKIIINRI